METKVELNGFSVTRKKNGDVNTDYICSSCGKSTTVYIEVVTNQGLEGWRNTYGLLCKGCLKLAIKTIDRVILIGPDENKNDIKISED